MHFYIVVCLAVEGVAVRCFLCVDSSSSADVFNITPSCTVLTWYAKVAKNSMVKKLKILFQKLIQTKLGRFAVSSAGTSILYFLIIFTMNLLDKDPDTAYIIAQVNSFVLNFFGQKLFVFKNWKWKRIIKEVALHGSMSVLFAWVTILVEDTYKIGGAWNSVVVAVVLCPGKFVCGFIVGKFNFDEKKKIA